MENPIKQIYRFNQQAGLLDKGYDDFLESAFQVEEALEGFELGSLCKVLNVPETFSPKDISRLLLNTLGPTKDDPYKEYPRLSNVDRLDKACDAVVFAVGSMAKLGLNPNQITRALNVVMTANNAKLQCPKDEYGKLTKPEDFDEKYAPEPKLQAILDERA